MDFLSAILQKDLPELYPVCMIVGSSDQGKILPQEDWVLGSHMASMRGSVWCMAVVHHTASAAKFYAVVGTVMTQWTASNWLLEGQIWARHPVVCIPLTPDYCNLRCHARHHWRMERRSVVFPDKNWFCLGVSDGHLLVRRRPGKCQQLTILRSRHTGPIPGNIVSRAVSYDSRSGCSCIIPMHPNCKFVHQSGDSTLCCHSWTAFKCVFSNWIMFALIQLLHPNML